MKKILCCVLLACVMAAAHSAAFAQESSASCPHDGGIYIVDGLSEISVRIYSLAPGCCSFVEETYQYKDQVCEFCHKILTRTLEFVCAKEIYTIDLL